MHIQHPEDSVLTGDLTVLDWFVNPGHLSVKIDGAPAICWGTNPVNGSFFVGTKAVFNKKKIRIAHNHQEIDDYYDGEVANILHECFDVLPRTETVYQADFIGFGGQTEYTPNVITYLFHDKIDQKIIIAPHTCYYAENDLRDAVAMPDRALWSDDQNVKYVKPTASILYDQTSFSDVDEICKFARQMATTVDFVSDKESVKIKKQINSCIRENKEINESDFDCDSKLISFWKLIKSIKDDCLFLCRNDGPDAYLNQDRIDAEGYIMTNEFGTYKLVNREVFSYHNFNHSRFQCASS